MATTPIIVQYLSATLSSDTNTRIAAELKLAEYLHSPDASLALSHLILAQDADPALRQSACIVLRKYVTERWSPYFQTFKGNAPAPEIKAQVRQAVFQGLSDGNRKIRSLCAHILSSIANSDWPDEYPELLTALIGLLSSGSPNSVHGSMQVFTEFIKSDLTEDQILPVLRQLLPVLLDILGKPESYDAPTRARTVSVFRQCVTALAMVKDQHPQATQEATDSVLPVWLEAFKVLLSIDPQQDLSNDGNWDGLAVRIQIFKTLHTIQNSFNKALTHYIPDLLNLSLTHLIALYPAFSHYYISSSASVPRTSEDETIELPQLICPIMDFVGALARVSKAKPWFVTQNLHALISSIFNLLQMTDEDEETWANDPNAFISQEDDETLAYSVRVAGFDLLSILVERLPAASVSIFQAIITEVVNSSQQARGTGKADWWRPLESALAGIGSPYRDVVEAIENEVDSGRPKPIDIEGLLANVVPSILGLAEHPFLQGRGFVFASQYAGLLPLQLASQYLDAAVQVIESNTAGVPVKVSAVKAIHNFCQNAEDAAIAPYASRISKDLGPFMLTTTDDALSLILEALSLVLEINDGSWLTPDLAESLTNAALQVWDKNNKDPLFLSILTEILRSLSSAKTNGIYEVAVKQALPLLSHAIANSKPNESWVASSGIELVNSLIEGAQADKGLGEGFFALLAPSLFKVLGEADDRDVLQNGITCLTLVIRKDNQQVINWTDNERRGGLDYVLKLVAKVLQSDDESGGLAIGDLIIHLLRKAGNAVLPVLGQLLEAMVRRMTTAQTASFLQSLIIPFAFLINNEPDTVLNLLESISIDGRSGLDILINTWCENAETFQGFWPSRISTLAFCRLFVSERPSLQHLMVKGDIIVNPETKNVIMTRSKTRQTPHQFTSVPFPVKAIKLLLSDVQSGGEAAPLAARGGVIDDIDSDDGDEEWTEEDKAHQGFKEEEYAFLSELIGPRGVALDNEDVPFDDNDDEDLKNDPVSQIDLQAHLVSFFKECAARNTNHFQQVVDQLKAEETVVVRAVVNS